MKLAKPIKVLLVDDNTVVRHGLSRLLKDDSDFLVVGEARNGRESVTMARSLHPDVVLMDISMPVMNGLEATRQIKVADPSIKVIILSAYDDKEYVDSAKAGGAAGYLTKMTFSDTLALAVRNVVKGCPFFGPSSGKGGPTKPPGRSGKAEIKGANLTSRESDVLRLRAGGAGNNQVAAKLCISVESVERHLVNLMGKLNIRHADDLGQFAFPA
jgi:two-component system nitrate/nitrite response regulator NarL